MAHSPSTIAMNSLPWRKKINEEMHICLGALVARRKVRTHKMVIFLPWCNLEAVGPWSLTMAMNKDSTPPSNLHGRNHIRTPTHVFPGGRKTLALMLTIGLILFFLSTYHPATNLYYSPMPTHFSLQETKTGTPLLTSIYSSALSSWCKVALNVTFWADLSTCRVPTAAFVFFCFLKFTGSTSFRIWYSCSIRI